MPRRRLVIDGRRLTRQRTGVGRYLETLLLEWSRSGWPLDDVVLIVADKSGLSRIEGCRGLTIKVVGEGWPGLIWERMGLGRVLCPDDLLFAPTNLIPGNWRGLTLLVVFDTMLEVAPEGFSRLVRWRFRGRYRSSARRATRILVPSDQTGREVVEHFGIRPENVRTVYPAIGPEFRTRAGDDPLVLAARRELGLGDDPFFLFVGKRSARRNVPVILDAFQDYQRLFGPSRLVFVGPQGGENDLGGIDGLTVAGFVSDDSLAGLMSTAVACLYPSTYEGFGLPVVEAMASGCPMITLSRGALRESAGDAAVTLDEVDAQSLITVMHALTKNTAERAVRIEAGLAQARKFQGPGFAQAVRDEIRTLAATDLRR